MREFENLNMKKYDDVLNRMQSIFKFSNLQIIIISFEDLISSIIELKSFDNNTSLLSVSQTIHTNPQLIPALDKWIFGK